jgi:PAS domain-containing protein
MSLRSNSVPKVVFIQSPDQLKQLFDSSVEFQDVRSVELAFAELDDEQDLAVFSSGAPAKALLETAAVFDLLPTGIAILDENNRITRANKRLIQWFPKQPLIGLNFYEALDNPTISGPELTPLASIVANKVPCHSLIEVDDRHFRMHAIPGIGARAHEIGGASSGRCRFGGFASGRNFRNGFSTAN